MQIVGAFQSDGVIASPLITSGAITPAFVVTALFQLVTESSGGVANESYPALEEWPTDETLRKTRANGGFLAFRFVGNDGVHEFGDYFNPNAGRSANEPISKPVKVA